MEHPKLSVLIPVFNGMPYIKEAVESVLNQDFKDYELIITDNQSNDGTWEYVSSLNDKRIKCFRNPVNLGMVGNWNKALEYARGEYIKVLPADDYLLPGALRKQVQLLDEHKEAVMVCGAKRVIDSSGKALFTKRFMKKNTLLDGKEAINLVVRSGSNSIGEGGCVMFRSKYLPLTGGFEDDIFYTEDIQLWFKLLLHGKLFVMPDEVAAFRISGISLSVQRSKEQLKGNFKFLDKYYQNKSFGIKKSSYFLGKAKAFVFFFVKQFIYAYLQLKGK
ncbi:MAG: glycosyltransferase [Bacteroidia bacterium]|nr:glycosyltransferase [Bacteroidia bacterium]